MYRDYFSVRKTGDMVYTEETDKKQTENIGNEEGGYENGGKTVQAVRQDHLF